LFGVGGAVSTIDKECETRNNAAIVVTGLKDETLAREILCEIKDVRQAAVRIGKPCLQDQAASRVSSAAPVPPPAPPAAPVAPDKPAVASLPANAPMFCHTKGLDVALYPECSAAAGKAVDLATGQPPSAGLKPSDAPKAAAPPVKAAASQAVTPVVRFSRTASWHPTVPDGQTGTTMVAGRADPLADHVRELEQILIVRREAAMVGSQPDDTKDAAGTRERTSRVRLAAIPASDQ
jgi:hypothetical protein